MLSEYMITPGSIKINYKKYKNLADCVSNCTGLILAIMHNA
jgi:hypothetical protein